MMRSPVWSLCVSQWIDTDVSITNTVLAHCDRLFWKRFNHTSLIHSISTYQHNSTKSCPLVTHLRMHSNNLPRGGLPAHQTHAVAGKRPWLLTCSSFGLSSRHRVCLAASHVSRWWGSHCAKTQWTAALVVTHIDRRQGTQGKQQSSDKPSSDSEPVMLITFAKWCSVALVRISHLEHLRCRLMQKSPVVLHCASAFTQWLFPNYVVPNATETFPLIKL